MVSTTRSSFGSNEKANKYAKENSRDKHGTPLEQLKKFVGIDDGPVEKGLVPRRKPVGSAEAEARKTADDYKAAYKDEKAAARVERNKGVTPPKPKPVGSAEAEARKTADGYKAAYKDEIAAARVERNKGVTPPKPTSRPDNGKNGTKVRAAPTPKSADEGKEASIRETERKANYLAGGPDRTRISGKNTSAMANNGKKYDSDDFGYKIGKALGDKRTKEQMVKDRKEANKADRDNR